MISPDTSLTLARMAQDFCAILLWGSVGFLAFLVPAQLSFQLSRTLLPGTRLLAFITFATTVAILPIQSARLGDGWVDAFNLDVLRDVLFQSNIGLSWFYQLATALLVLIAATIFPKLLGILAVLAGLLLASRTLSGHAVILDRTWGIFLHLNYVAHVLAAGAWVGALLPVILIMRDMSRQITEQQTRAVRNFSIVGHFVVTIAVLSGLINALLIRDRLLPLFAGPYDMTLAIKIALVAAMIAIAIVNRYVIVPRISASGRETAILSILTTVEFALAVSVLIIVNILSTMNPH